MGMGGAAPRLRGLQNVVQPLDLRGLSGDDDVVVALPVVGLQVGGDEVEVLVEAWLRDHVPVDDHPIRNVVAVELHNVEGFEQAFQPFRCDEQGFRRGEFDSIRNAFKGALRALHGLFQLAFRALGSAIQMRVSAGIKLNSGSTDSWRLWSPMLGTTTARVILLTLSWEMGSNFGWSPLHRQRTQCGRDGQTSRKTHRQCPRAPRIARFVDKINLAEPVLDEHLVEEVHGVLLAQGQGKGLFGKSPCDDLLGNGFER